MAGHPIDCDNNTLNRHKAAPTSAVGILGGGQLAQMLADAARSLSLKPHVFASRPDDVAISHADAYTLGSFEDPATLRQFFEGVQTCVYENEWIRPEILEQALSGGVASLRPKPETMAACGDKLQQKKLLLRLDIPSPRFESLSPSSGICVTNWLLGLSQSFPDGCVLKWAKGGYDGKGTLLYLPSNDPGTVPEDVRIFVEQAMTKQVYVYAEQLVRFEQELALITIRETTGKCSYYPLVYTKQEDGICAVVSGPASHLGLDERLEAKARAYGQKIGEVLELEGVFAIEFFLDETQKLLVNEIAPRVHNSGHFSMDGAKSSQFENHWRAALGWPLADTSCHNFFGMVNILGPQDYTGPLDPPRISLGPSKVHWYEKSESRPGRKIGHVNTWANDRAQLEQAIAEIRQQLQHWSQSISHP